MEGVNIEPFARQVLLGGASKSQAYRSVVYDAFKWTSLTWWLDVIAGLPGTVSNPLILYIETNDSPGALDTEWVALNPGGASPNVKPPVTGTVTPTAKFIRFRVVLTTGEAVAFAVRAVGAGIGAQVSSTTSATHGKFWNTLSPLESVPEHPVLRNSLFMGIAMRRLESPQSRKVNQATIM